MLYKRYKKPTKAMDIIVIFLTIPFLVILKILQILFFKSDVSGLFIQSIWVYIIEFIIFIGTLIGILLIYNATQKQARILRGITVKPPVIVKYIFYIVGLLFVFQIIRDITIAKIQNSINIYFIIILVFSFLSVISFASIGLMSSKNIIKLLPYFMIVPFFWTMLVALNNIFFATSILISYQFGYSNYLLIVLAVLFFYSLVKHTFDYKVSNNYGNIFFISSFFFVGTIHALPYAILLIFGIHDRISKTPYLAFLGISLISICFFINYIFASKTASKKVKPFVR